MTDDNAAMNRLIRGLPAEQPTDHDNEHAESDHEHDDFNAVIRRAAGRTPAPTTPEGTAS